MTRAAENVGVFEPAFPVSDGTCTQQGMSLRDWFAGQIAGHLATQYHGNDWGRDGKEHAPIVARKAYAVADALIGQGVGAPADAGRASRPSAQAPAGLGDAATIPSEIVEQVLSMGRVEWGATAEQVAADHVADFEETLRLTRETFNYEDVPVALHGLYLEGTETVLCHTGTSPNSGTNARILAGLWNELHDALAARGDQP